MKRQKDRTLKDEFPSWWVLNMLLEISGEITPERMKRRSQSENNTQLCMWLVMKIKSNAVNSNIASVQFSSVSQSCLTSAIPWTAAYQASVHHQVPKFTQTHVHWVHDTIKSSHPLSFPSPPALNLSQHKGLFKWVSSSPQMTRVLEFQLQHQSFQWILYGNL